MTLDTQILIELRPPAGGPETFAGIVRSLLVLSRCGVKLPDITTAEVLASLHRLRGSGQVTGEGDGIWRFTPANAKRQRGLF